MLLNQIWLHFLTQIASKIHFRSTCLLMMSYFTLDLSKKQSRNKILVMLDEPELVFGPFLVSLFQFVSEVLIGRLVCGVDIIYVL